MVRPICAALMISMSATAASADIIDVGRFENAGWGEISYDGRFGDHVRAEGRMRNNIRYTVVTIDVAAIVREMGANLLLGVSTIDTGDNIYTGAPGADIDLFRFDRIGDDAMTFLYDGTTEEHINETSAQLLARVRELDWGTGNGRPSGGKFVSLGEFGRLTAVLNDPYEIIPGGGGGGGGGEGPNRDLLLEISEAGNLESFDVHLMVQTVPAPGALALLGFAAVCARTRRRRS